MNIKIDVQQKLKRLVLVLGTLGCLLSAPFVFSAAQDPISMLKSVTNNVMQELRTHRQEVQQNSNKLYALVDHLILPHVDFSEMARWVVGRSAWKSADNATQSAFITEFKTMVVRSYARSLLEYTDQKIEFLPLRGAIEDKQRIKVLSLIKENGKDPIHMDYNLIRDGNDWKVYDIIVEGISLMQGYRAQFADDIKQGGLKAAIARMHRHNTQRKSTSGG
ncbi:MAG TPA: ABC transporter substrate-binding protein [Gammaproteobacteria bacterium]|nr:ABC transporter substrate-binding protein [Gammaproteobacteria bacterium]HQZ87142.1 ABC transporter substrate-binding protein [Gammaproteobacteria bacterium]HRA42384.1 ABC transporter substrate-binding protein [Gammaproteobacteria bacterium]